MKIQSFIVCDDIRQEMARKHTLVGVYDDEINFRVTPDKKGTWPKYLDLNFFMRLKLETDKPKFFNFKVRLGDNVIDIVKGADVPSLGIPSFFNIVYQFKNFKFTAPEEMCFSFDLLDKDKSLIKTLDPDIKLKINEVVVG